MPQPTGPRSIPGRVIFLAEGFPGFFSIVRQISGNLGNKFSPGILFCPSLSSKIIIIRLRMTTISYVRSSTWPPLKKTISHHIAWKQYSVYAGAGLATAIISHLSSRHSKALSSFDAADFAIDRSAIWDFTSPLKANFFVV